MIQEKALKTNPKHHQGGQTRQDILLHSIRYNGLVIQPEGASYLFLANQRAIVCNRATHDIDNNTKDKKNTKKKITMKTFYIAFFALVQSNKPIFRAIQEADVEKVKGKYREK